MKIFGTFLIIIICNSTNLYGQTVVLGEKKDSLTDTQRLNYFVLDGPNSKLLSKENSRLFEIRTDDMVFVIDSEDSLTLTQIEPRWIESIKVIKGQDAINQYGTKAKNGVVSIELKKDSFSILPLEIKRKLKSGN